MTVTRRKEGVVVPPMSEAMIAQSCGLLRGFMPQGGGKYLPVLALYEMLWLFDDNARFEVLEDHHLGDDDARTYPDRGLIQLRQSVYDGAARGEARARFTMCHELGHLGLHRGIAFNRVNPASPPKIFQNSEWQADIFASHLLMPAHLLASYSDVHGVMRDFGVSFAAAETRLRKMKKGVTKLAVITPFSNRCHCVGRRGVRRLHRVCTQCVFGDRECTPGLSPPATLARERR